MKKRPKTVSTSRTFEYFILSRVSRIFYPEPAPAPGEREHNVGIFWSGTSKT